MVEAVFDLKGYLWWHISTIHSSGIHSLMQIADSITTEYAYCCGQLPSLLSYRPRLHRNVIGRWVFTAPCFRPEEFRCFDQLDLPKRPRVTTPQGFCRYLPVHELSLSLPKHRYFDVHDGCLAIFTAPQWMSSRSARDSWSCRMDHWCISIRTGMFAEQAGTH